MSHHGSGLGVHSGPRVRRLLKARTPRLVLALSLIAWCAAGIAVSAHRAKASPSRLPVPGEWSATTQVYQNANGSQSATIAASPIQGPDDGSPTGWSPIDTTLEDLGTSVQPRLIDGTLSLSKGGAGPLATIESDYVTFSVSWPDPLPAPTLDGDTATYADVMPATNLRVRAAAKGFEQSLVFDSVPTEAVVIDLSLSIDGATATLSDGGALVLTDPRGIVVGTVPQPLMWGAAVDPETGEPLKVEAVPTALVPTEDGATALELRPDPDFFSDPDVTYPITLDPTVDLGVEGDTFVSSAQPTTTFGSDVNLKSGKGTGTGSPVFRSLLSFDITPSVLGHVTGASLDLWENFTPNCTATPADLWSLTDEFDQSVTWNTQPGVGSRYASVTAAQGNTGCSAATVTFSTGGDNGHTLTDLVQTWADDPNLQPGLEIRAHDETTTSQFKAFNSAQAGSHPPVLHVTYNHDPDVPLGLYTTGTAPNLTMHGIFSDPEGGTGYVKYTVYDGTGSQVYTGNGSTVSSGSDSPLTPPSGTLQTGYTWTAQGYDGTYDSEVSSAVSNPVQPATTTGPYNVVVFMIDDLDWNTFQDAVNASGCDACDPIAGGIMPNYYKYFVHNNGTGQDALALSFDNAYVTYSLCCPARATFFTGQYAHNTNVQNNEPPNGGCQAYRAADLDQSDIAKWLHDAGYFSGMIGKYLNGYGIGDLCPAKDTRDTYWDYWRSLLYTNQYNAAYENHYAVRVGTNGFWRNPPPPDAIYQPTKLGGSDPDAYAEYFINHTNGQKFMLYLAPSAPHLDPESTGPSDCNYGQTQNAQHPWGYLPSIPVPPGTREDLLEGDSNAYWTSTSSGPWADIFTSLSYDAANTDKNAAVHDIDHVHDTCANDVWVDRLESLMFIDDMIGEVGDTLVANQLLSKTVMIFTSDNGFYNGEHRLHEKIAPYEEGIHVPLTIRYPGLNSEFDSSTPSDILVLNTDLAPTIADLTNARTLEPTSGPSTNHAVDGQSLYNYLTFGSTAWRSQSTWSRHRFGIEHWVVSGGGLGDTVDSAGGDFYCEFHGIRTGSDATPDQPDILYTLSSGTGAYSDCDTGPNPYEYYALGSDPLELSNQCSPTFVCPGAVDSDLRDFSDDFLTCNATGVDVGGNTVPTCQAVENAVHNPEDPYAALFPDSYKNGQTVPNLDVVGTGFASGTYKFCYEPVGSTTCTDIGMVTATTDTHGRFLATGLTFSTGSAGIGTIEVLVNGCTAPCTPVASA